MDGQGRTIRAGAWVWLVVSSSTSCRNELRWSPRRRGSTLPRETPIRNGCGKSARPVAKYLRYGVPEVNLGRRGKAGRRISCTQLTGGITRAIGTRGPRDRPFWQIAKVSGPVFLARCIELAPRPRPICPIPPRLGRNPSTYAAESGGVTCSLGEFHPTRKRTRMLIVTSTEHPILSNPDRSLPSCSPIVCNTRWSGHQRGRFRSAHPLLGRPRENEYQTIGSR